LSSSDLSGSESDPELQSVSMYNFSKSTGRTHLPSLVHIKAIASNYQLNNVASQRVYPRKAFIHRSVRLPIPFSHSSIHLSIHSGFFRDSFHSFCLFIIHPSIHPSVRSSIHSLSIRPFIYASIHSSVRLSIHSPIQPVVVYPSLRLINQSEIVTREKEREREREEHNSALCNIFRPTNSVD